MKALKSFYILCIICLSVTALSAVTLRRGLPIVHLMVNNQAVLTNDFLGVNAVYHGFAYMPTTEFGQVLMNDDDRQGEFQRVKSMDLKIARTWYRPNWACSANIYSPYNWESTKMRAFYSWLGQMKNLNVDVALQAGWAFPQDTYYGQKTPDSTRDIDRYADWVNESLYQMIKVRGYTNIKYLMLFTEPLKPRPRAGKMQMPVNKFAQPEYYAKVCEAINSKLVASGMRPLVKIVGPDVGSTDTAAFINWSVKNLNNVIDIYSWHTYNGKQFNTNPPLEYDGWRQIAEVGQKKIASTGKPYWIDEYGANRPNETVRFKPDYGNYLAQAVAAFINSGAQTSLLWILFDQKYEGSFTSNDSFYHGVQRWGLVGFPHDSAATASVPRPAWYAFSMMSKYLGGRAGTQVYKTTNQDSLYIVSTKSGSNLSVMVVNAAHTARRFNITFAQAVNCTFNRHLYDPAKIKVLNNTDIIPTDKKFNDVSNVFDDEIPARGVSIYTTITN